MQRYVVSAANKNTRLVALTDSTGRHHVAQCTSNLPMTESLLSGAVPAVGFALLMGLEGDPYRLIFSHIDCNAQWMLDEVHAAQTTSSTYQRGPTQSAVHAGAE
jgi:hypothetical protein